MLAGNSFFSLAGRCSRSLFESFWCCSLLNIQRIMLCFRLLVKRHINGRGAAGNTGKGGGTLRIARGALAAVTYYDEFKCYYKRKLQEGKPKMLILNNVRNKIILRLAAVIRNDKPYMKQVA